MRDGSADQLIPQKWVEDYSLYHLDIYSEMEEYIQRENTCLGVYGVRAWKEGDKYILLYAVKRDYNDASACYIMAHDYRIAIYEPDHTISQNVFFAGYVDDEGESLVARKLSWAPGKLILDIDPEKSVFLETYGLEKRKEIKY